MSLFHNSWWLDAVAGSTWQEVTVSENGAVVGRLPFFAWRSMGGRVLGMPPMTRTLGPLVVPGTGKAHGQRAREARIVGELIAKLPPHALFKQNLPPGFPNPLPFQFHGFSLSCEYLFELDATAGLDRLWNELPSRTRTMIRRARQLYESRICHDVDAFHATYESHRASRGHAMHFDLTLIRRVHEACVARDSGAIMALYDAKGTIAAAIFVAWTAERMHFLLQTRGSTATNGAIECLVWEAARLASERRQVLDLDGIPNETAARRMSQFGGEIRQRTLAMRGHFLMPTWRHFRRELRWRLGHRDMFI